MFCCDADYDLKDDWHLYCHNVDIISDIFLSSIRSKFFFKQSSDISWQAQYPCRSQLLEIMANSNKEVKLPKAINFIIYMVATIVVGFDRHIKNFLKYSWIGLLLFLAICFLAKIKLGLTIEIHQGANIYSF